MNSLNFLIKIISAVFWDLSKIWIKKKNKHFFHVRLYYFTITQVKNILFKNTWLVDIFRKYCHSTGKNKRQRGRERFCFIDTWLLYFLAMENRKKMKKKIYSLKGEFPHASPIEIILDSRAEAWKEKEQ